LKRVIVGLVAAFVLLSLVPAASSAIKITRIYFDSPGSDTGSNASRNAEWIRLKNTGSAARSLKGWRVRDAAGHVYVFGTYSLAGGLTVTIHTGNGSNTARHRYWRSGSYIWNNDGDTARLRRANGTLVDTCSYSGAGSAVNC
jgi:hypothetical protein